MKKLLLVLGLMVLPVLPITLSGCLTTSDGEQGLESLEMMSESDYQRLKLYSTLGVKIAAHRLVENGNVTSTDLTIAADILESVKSTPVQDGAEALIRDLLNDTGLTSTEVEALLSLVVFELADRGVFDVLGPDGTILLAPRTEDFIDSLIQAIRDAATVSEEEFNEAREMGVSE